MPAALKRSLVREVARSGGNLNDVAVGILAERFGVPHSPTGRRSPLPGGSGVVVLRMPAELKQAVQAEAFRSGSNTNDVILESFALHLGLPFQSNRRRSVPFGGGRGNGKEPMASTNGHKARSADRVRVALIGVGNCANSLVQGLEFYKGAKPD